MLVLKQRPGKPHAGNSELGIIWLDKPDGWEIWVDPDRLNSYVQKVRGAAGNAARVRRSRVLVKAKHGSYLSAKRRNPRLRSAIEYIRKNTKPQMDRKTIAKYLDELGLPRK